MDSLSLSSAHVCTMTCWNSFEELTEVVTNYIANTFICARQLQRLRSHLTTEFTECDNITFSHPNTLLDLLREVGKRAWEQHITQSSTPHDSALCDACLTDKRLLGDWDGEELSALYACDRTFVRILRCVVRAHETPKRAFLSL